MKKQYIEKQKYSECQLVAVINAAIFFGATEVGDAEYERLVDLVGARYGSAISIERALKHFGLKVFPAAAEFDILKRTIRAGFPVGLSVFTGQQGSHVALAVDVHGSRVKTLNLKGYNWIEWRLLVDLLRSSSEFGASGGSAALLKLPSMLWVFEDERRSGKGK